MHAHLAVRYECVALTANDERVFIEYTRHAPNDPPMPVAEVFDVRDNQIVACTRVPWVRRR